MMIWWLDTIDKGNVRTGTIELGYNFRGEPRKESWIQPEIKYMGMSNTPKDFVSFGTCTAFLVSQRVADFLGKDFSNSVELIEFPKIKGRTYYLVNVIKLISDCVDLDKSGVTWNDKGEIQNINGHVFKENCFVGPEIFKVKEFPCNVYVTDDFKKLLEAHKFKGMKFIRPEVTLRDLFYGTY